MSSWIIPGPSLSRYSYRLKGIDIISGATIETSQAHYHKITVGVQDQSFIDALGTWNLSEFRLPAGEAQEMSDGDRDILVGDNLMVKVEKFGLPATLVGVTVTVHLALKTPAAVPTSGLPPATEEAVLALANQLEVAGLSERCFTINLHDGP